MGCCCAPMKGSNNETKLEGKVVVITGKLFLLESLHYFSLIPIMIQPLHRGEHWHRQGDRSGHEQERGESDHSVQESGKGQGSSQ